jgi:hypothetical protein
MNLRKPTPLLRATTIFAGVMLLSNLSTYALNYNVMDMLLCFRVLTGGEDMEVDLGSATNFNNLPAGTVLTITNYSQASIARAYGGDYTTLNWAAFACVGSDGSGFSSPAFPYYSLWVTKPRQNPILENTPWLRREVEGGGTLTLTENDINNIGSDGTQYSGPDWSPPPVNPVKDNATTILIPSGNYLSYSSSQNVNTGPPGSFGGDWEGTMENVTPGESAPFPWVSRSDLFFMTPVPTAVGSSGIFLGYFEFKDDGTNGTTTFHAADGPPPGITSILTSTGPESGGTSVTLVGTNFFNDANLMVEFGTNPATSITFNSADSVTATAPASTNAGPVDVILINSDGQYTVLPSAFTYVNSGPSGAVQVTILPPAVVAAGATWQVDGGALETNDAVVTGLPLTGTHTVSFEPVTGWTTPASQIITVTNGATNMITGTYVEQFGSLTVTILPSTAALAGAEWQVDGGTLQTSGATVSGLSVAGTHTVSFTTVTGYDTPGSQMVTITNGDTTTLTATYLLPSGALQVTILPPEVVAAGAEWELDNSGIFLTNDEVVLGLSVTTNHTVTFTNIPGWITPSSEIVSVTNGTTNLLTGTYLPETGSLQVMILPPAVVAAGAEWQIDGGAWETNGAVVSVSVLTNHTVTFTNVNNWTTPGNLIVSVTNATTNVVTGTYISVAGSLTVTITPPQAITAGAEWQVDGGLYASGATANNLSPGQNTVSFQPITGWNTPSNQEVDISTGVTSATVGNYTFKKKGIPTVAITSPITTTLSLSNDMLTVKGTARDEVVGVPLLAVYYELNGSSWTLASSTNSWSNWFAIVTLNPGVNSIRAYAVDISGVAHTNLAFNFKYIPSATLTVQKSGFGTITPIDNGKLLSIGTNYTLLATPSVNNLFSNWIGGTSQPYSVLSTNPSLKFAMQPNLVLQANFVSNFFLTAQGPYHGLFAPTNTARTQSNSGAFNLNVTSLGSFSGTLQFGNSPVILSGKFDVSGYAVVLPLKNAKNPLTTSLQLDLVDRSVQGSVSNSSFVANLNGDQLVFNATTHKATNFEGAYTFMIPGANDPTVGPLGASYGTAKVAATGTITFSVYLADGTSLLAQSSVVSKDGFWPFYVPLYSGHGSIWGWNSISNGAILSVSEASWINETNSIKTDLYRSGFTNQGAQVIGSSFAASEKPALALTNGLVTLDGGNLPFIITNEFNLASNNAITLPTAAENTNKLVLKISLTGNGVISGTFANPSEPQHTITINGVLLQNQTNAVGYFLGTNESGLFLLQNSN